MKKMFLVFKQSVIFVLKNFLNVEKMVSSRRGFLV